MLNNIKISRYIEANSLVHCINSLVKIISIFLLTIIVIINNNIYFQISLLLCILLLLILSKIPIIMYLKSINFFNIFLISIIIINLLLGTSLIDSIIQVLKILNLMFYSNIIVMTTSIKNIKIAVKKIFKPFELFKIDTNQLSLVISLTIKFIPLVLDIANNTIKNLRLKGINFYHTSFKNKLLILRKTIIPIFYISLKKSSDIADIMEFKLYTLNDNNKKLDKFKFIDIIVIIIYIVLLLIAVKWR